MRGIAHVGALGVLEEQGYEVHRTAGASAGALIAAFAAAELGAARMAERLHAGLDLAGFREAHGLARFGLGGRLAAVWRDNGAFAGDRLRDWLHAELKTAGVEHFGDLRLPGDPDGPPLAEDERYRLVVVVADLSLGQLVRLPWDYRRLYGLDPDRQLVADAVRASTSIPFFFKPVRLGWADAGRFSHLVDGGLVSDFPIGIFDRADGRPPRWPTFGIKLSRPRSVGEVAHEIDGLRSFATAVFETAISGNDQSRLSQPCIAARTIFVDPLGIPSTEFRLAAAERERLYASGREAALRFLERWDWETYVRECRSG